MQLLLGLKKLLEVVNCLFNRGTEGDVALHHGNVLLFASGLGNDLGPRGLGPLKTSAHHKESRVLCGTVKTDLEITLKLIFINLIIS